MDKICDRKSLEVGGHWPLWMFTSMHTIFIQNIHHNYNLGSILHILPAPILNRHCNTRKISVFEYIAGFKICDTDL